MLLRSAFAFGYAWLWALGKRRSAAGETRERARRVLRHWRERRWRFANIGPRSPLRGNFRDVSGPSGPVVHFGGEMVLSAVAAYMKSAGVTDERIGKAFEEYALERIARDALLKRMGSGFGAVFEGFERYWTLVSKGASITVKGKPVKVTVSTLQPFAWDRVVGSTVFKNWLSSLDASIELQALDIQSVDMFGPNVGFLKMNSTVVRNGKQIPGTVLLRGPAVSVLVVLEDSSTGQRYTLMVEQPRVPTGRIIQEAPAGMTDGAEWRGTAVRELEEETGIKVDGKDLVDLGGVWTSPGLLDEEIGLYLLQLKWPGERIRALEGKLAGIDDHEQIRVRIHPLLEAVRRTKDAKFLAAYALWTAKCSGTG